ncbi:MAG TPA: Hsp20/alpha crystallin family protein [Candidatus Peribacteraceae bacterium]|nr:Hsp20/alpha crystallin family protein [Candidatus Peribacteraceae bacterium]
MSSPFPFHGIFSSLNSEQMGQPADDPFAGGTPALPDFESAKPQPRSTGQVAVDIYEQDNYYIIKAPIAGVKLSDLDIEITDNIVTIRGHRQQTDQIPNDQYYLQECFWGEFSRSITLPFTIDPKKIRATFNKECILKILIPKEEKVKIVRINEV